MVPNLLQLTAAAYLLAGVAAGAGLALGHRGLVRAAAWALFVGAVLHGASFSLLHTNDPTPPLTHGPTALSFTAWVGVLAYLILLWRFRLAGLVALVGPLAFVSVFYAAAQLPHLTAPDAPGGGSLPHLHVLLATGGLALLGLAGLAGALYLTEYRRLKRKRSLAGSSPWPSLEALDRVNALALGVGFPLLTLGVVTGALWVRSMHGSPWTGSPHETWSLMAWLIYAALTALRFLFGQGARRSALSAVAGFVFAGVSVIGVELWQ